MKRSGLGLQKKFVVVLLISAALPFLVGLVVLETIGYQHLVNERGKLHQIEALTLAHSVDQASMAKGGQLRTWFAADPTLIHFVAAKNRESAAMTSDEVALETRRLNELWPTLSADDPQVLALLKNPGSESLLKYQSLHPETAEILATDIHGRLVTATGKTTDVEQSDEAWWQKGASLPNNGQWTENLRYDASSGVFSLDVILPLYDGDTFVGVVKMSVNVTSLFALLKQNSEQTGELWQIVLTDGKILASSESGTESLKDQLPAETLAELRQLRRGWSVALDRNNEARMMGFVKLGPDAYIVFSSLCDDVEQPLRMHFLWLGLAGATLLALCLLVGFHLIRHKILLPLAVLGRTARSISTNARLRQSPHQDEGHVRMQHTQAEIDIQSIQAIRTGDEIEALAGDLAVMASRVLRYQHELETEVAAKTSVIQEDLEMAREFQTALLPSRYPEVPSSAIHNPLRLKFAHFYQPATIFGGDFFDLIELDENRVGILIADVMGHGARSALITAILRALVKNHSSEACDPGGFLTELNHDLTEVFNRSGQTLFVTAFFLILDTRNAKASWAVAGHPAPLRVRRGSGKPPSPLWEAPPRQPALGLIAAAEYQSSDSPLKAGDIFLLFTDGSVEAENPDGEMFGVNRLAGSLDQALDGPMAAMPAKIVCDVTVFQKRNTYDDDVCLVAVEALQSVRKSTP